MLKEYHIFFRRIMIACDLCIVCAAFFLGFLLRDNLVSFYKEPGVYILLLLILLALWGSLLYSLGMYDFFRTRQITDILFIIIETALLSAGLFGCFLFIAKMHFVSRMHIFYSFSLAALLLCVEKAALLKFLRYQHKKGINTRNILIVGTGYRAQQFIDMINKRDDWGIKIVGLVDDNIDKTGAIHGHKVIGAIKDIRDIIHNHIVDEVVFVIPRSWLGMIEETMYICDTEGVQVSIAVDLFELRISKAKYRYIGKFPLLTFKSAPDKLLCLFVKRLFDMLSCFIMIIMLLPFFMIVAVLVKITSKGRVFFKQERCGLNGRRFILYKFRTMVEGAEAKINELYAYNEMKGPVFKIKNDPRLTKIGGFLRKSSIDELPQLWNVLKGDMSLVGPRPPIQREVNNYEAWQRRRLSMRPGITCLWQTNGRNKITDFDEWMRLDLEYIDNWSLWLDCKILLKTVPVVLFGIGAK